MIDEYTNKQMRNASPDSMFNAQRKPSRKLLEDAREYRDSEASDGFEKEQADALVEFIKEEVVE